MKKRIVCFGDSNTWGYCPIVGSRYDEDTRWTGVLQNKLGSDYAVIEEGLNNRTTVIEDIYRGVSSGISFLETCLLTNKPVDLLIIMLGTNDTKNVYNVPALLIGQGAERLVRVALNSESGPDKAAPQILLVSPPHLRKNDFFKEVIDDNSIQKSMQLADYYQQVAQKRRIHFLDVAPFVVSSDEDGVHLNAQNHRILGQLMAENVKKLID